MRPQYPRLFHPLLLLLIALVSWLSAVPAKGFALLGPYADWMDVTNGFRQFDDIGGPIKEGYRWNVPVLSYGFRRTPYAGRGCPPMMQCWAPGPMSKLPCC